MGPPAYVRFICVCARVTAPMCVSVFFRSLARFTRPLASVCVCGNMMVERNTPSVSQGDTIQTNTQQRACTHTHTAAMRARPLMYQLNRVRGRNAVDNANTGGRRPAATAEAIGGEQRLGARTQIEHAHHVACRKSIVHTHTRRINNNPVYTFFFCWRLRGADVRKQHTHTPHTALCESGHSVSNWE